MFLSYTTRTPKEILQAIHDVARITQEGLRVFWLKRFVERGEMPIISETDQRRAKEQRVDIYARVEQIAHHARKSSDLFEHATLDARPSFSSLRSTLFVTGFITLSALILEKYLWSGFARMALACVPLLWTRGKEIVSAYRSGISRARSLRAFVSLYFLVALVSVLIVRTESVFVFVIVLLLPFILAQIQKIQKYHQSLERLKQAGKLPPREDRTKRLAIQEWWFLFETRAILLVSAAVLAFATTAFHGAAIMFLVPLVSLLLTFDRAPAMR